MFRPCVVFIVYFLVVGCADSQENNSFVEPQVYGTDAFRFEVPKPWFYAIPDHSQKKNVARCFLRSRLQMTAEGLFLVDAGRATETKKNTIDGMIKVMKNGKDEVEIQREDVALDGDKAVHLKSRVADYRVPCSVIVNEHNGTLYLIMMSVSKKSDFENRDLMLQALLKTWKWKEAGKVPGTNARE
jgi:hypothetical protein